MINLIKTYILPRHVVDISIFYLPLMLIGVVGARLNVFSFDILIAIIVNYFLLNISFLYNDIIDAEDDVSAGYKGIGVIQHWKVNLGLAAKTGGRPSRNPFLDTKNSKNLGYYVIALLTVVSLGLSYLINMQAFLIAVAIFVLAILYSGGLVRFKKYPIIDLLSHALLLSGLPILYFYTFNASQLSLASWLLFAAAFLFSVSGDLWNEYADFKQDSESGFLNTAILIGKKNTLRVHRILSPLTLATSVVCILYILITGLLA